jgi:hypothetical protein
MRDRKGRPQAALLFLFSDIALQRYIRIHVTCCNAHRHSGLARGGAPRNDEGRERPNKKPGSLSFSTPLFSERIYETLDCVDRGYYDNTKVFIVPADRR